MNLLEKPHYELEQAKSYLAEMSSAKSLAEFEAAWKHYLSRLERVWNKFLAVYKTHIKWGGWGGSHVRIRREDSLLSYLTNARGADEHSVIEIMENAPGSMSINPAFGNSLYLKKLTIDKGNIFIDSNEQLKITFAPAKIRLLPITNRGFLFPVPTSHLGNPVNPDDIVTIAKLGIEYYSKMLEESKGVFI